MLRNYGSYGLVLFIHSVIRWLVVAAGLYAVARAWRGRLGQHAWLKADTRAGRLFVAMLDLQLLAGVVLYGVFSPSVAGALLNPGMAMHSRGLRFWMIEHPLAAIVAVALAHVGFVKARRGGTFAHRDGSIYFTLALIIVLAAIPWPIFWYGRALWPAW